MNAAHLLMAAGLIGAVTAVACGPKGPTERQLAVESITRTVMAPQLDALVSTSEALAAAAEDYCASPSSDGYISVAEAWRAVRVPWKTLEFAKFGPKVEQPYRVGPKMDFWPPRDEDILDYLAGDGGVAPEDFLAMGTNTRGLPAVEVLLFLDGEEESAEANFESNPRRCDYLMGLTRDIVALSETYRSAWVDDWFGRLERPTEFDEDDYELTQDVINEWVNRCVFTVEDLRVEKLGGPLGDGTGANPYPGLLESPYGLNSLSDAAAALNGVDLVFLGGAAEPGDAGLSALIPADKRDDILTSYEEWMTKSRQRLGDVPEPLRETIYADPGSVEAAQQALRRLQIVLQVDLSQALSVQSVPNDNDGD